VLSVFAAAAVTCFAALFIGQAVLRLIGAKEWNWLAPAVGLSVLMLVATPAFSIPGRTTTVAIVLALATVAAAVWCLGSVDHRPSLRELLATVPAVFLVMVPFLAYGRGGILGPTIDSDMATHLIFVESYVSAIADKVIPIPADYPMGPHSVSALLSHGLGIKSEFAFSGFTMALPLVTAMTALAAARRASWLSRTILATVVALPFLVAAYYGQGSFKEIGMAGLTLAVTLAVAGYGPALGRGRWVPIALLTGGIVSIYSPAGLPWPVAIIGLWLVGLLAIAAYRHRLRSVPDVVRRELPALGIGLGVLILVLLPQVTRMYEFVAVRNGGSDIEATNLGNLAGPLPGWESFGVWGNADYRLGNPDPTAAHIWFGFVFVLVLIGSVWAFRKRRWILPLAAAAALLIWKASVQDGQSPYVSAKALVIVSPLLMLLAVMPLSERPETRRAWPWFAALFFGLVLLVRVGTDDLRTLRYFPVGPTERADQLESFRPLLAGHKTLYLGDDEFIRWELAGVPVMGVAAATELRVGQRKGKWEFGQAMDFDTVKGSTLNEYEYVVASRDFAGSAVPANLRLVAASEGFAVYKRVGPVPERSILDEGQWPGAVLDCRSPEGRKVLKGGGVAAVRLAPITAKVPTIQAGHATQVQINLPPGKWHLEAPYQSPFPITVKGLGLEVERPANLERPGQRLPLGIVSSTGGEQTITLEVGTSWLAPSTATASVYELVATRVGEQDRLIPIHRACGRYVDWYRSAGQA
jgi:hypothetical protein